MYYIGINFLFLITSPKKIRKIKKKKKNLTYKILSFSKVLGLKKTQVVLLLYEKENHSLFLCSLQFSTPSWGKNGQCFCFLLINSFLDYYTLSFPTRHLLGNLIVGCSFHLAETQCGFAWAVLVSETAVLMRENRERCRHSREEQM